MQVNNYSDEQEWLAARVGKITGTRLATLIDKTGKGKIKKGFYELIAERVATEKGLENPMERGKRLESEAIERFVKETGKKVDASLVMWVSDDDDNIAISPDGTIGKTEAMEVKCINSASHIEAYLTEEIPDDYEFQILQYFIVNDNLKKLYFVFYDPRIPAKDFFYYVVNRKDKQEEIKKYKAEQLRIIKEVEKITLELTKF